MGRTWRKQIDGVRMIYGQKRSLSCSFMYMWFLSLAFGSRLQTNWTGYLHPPENSLTGPFTIDSTSCQASSA